MIIKHTSFDFAQGQRSYMEDQLRWTDLGPGTIVSVFDGHGGPDASEKAMLDFHAIFDYELDISVGDPVLAYREAIRHLADELSGYDSGTTLSSVYVPLEGNQAFTAVLGDSPIIIGNGSRVWTAPEHNVRTNLTEAEAVKARGGYIINGYACSTLYGGGLQMSRALGDCNLHSILSTKPEIDNISIAEGDFILVASDGLFDPGHHNYQESAKGILRLISKPEVTAKDLVNDAISRETGDNVTAILIRF